MLETVGVGILFSVALIILLVLILLFASLKLVNTGEVTIEINGDSDGAIKTEAGSTLLSTLSNNKLLLPSACGGGGTCAMCLCQIYEGGGNYGEKQINLMYLNAQMRCANIPK